MKSMAPTPAKDHLRQVIHYLVDCLSADEKGGEAAFGAVQPAPPPPRAAQAICEFLERSAR